MAAKETGTRPFFSFLLEAASVCLGCGLRFGAFGEHGGVRKAGSRGDSHVAESAMGFEIAARSRVGGWGRGDWVSLRAGCGKLRVGWGLSASVLLPRRPLCGDNGSSGGSAGVRADFDQVAGYEIVVTDPIVN